jgi:glycosyltransferase involved in cell wall biosynthesis
MHNSHSEIRSPSVVDNIPRKRILDCYVGMKFGGLARHVVVEVNGLQARGHQVNLALQYVAGELVTEISPEVVTCGLGYRGPYSYPRMVLNLVRFARRVEPEVIVSHAWSVDAIAIFASLFCRVRPRIILFRHTLVRNLPEPVTADGKLRLRLLKVIARYSYKRADVIVAVSPGVKMELVSCFGMSPQRVHVLPSLWDLEKTISDAREDVQDPWFIHENRSTPVILGSGTLAPAKDFPMLMRAFALIRKHVPARLVIVGDGPLKPALLDLAEKLGIIEDFRILGYQSNPAKYVVRANVFALSSVVEGFANVLVEALILGVPVIATNVGGPSYVLDGGRYGLLVPPQDERAMADAIITVLENKSLRARLRKFGPERARVFEPGKILDQIEKVLVGLEPEEIN